MISAIAARKAAQAALGDSKESTPQIPSTREPSPSLDISPAPRPASKRKPNPHTRQSPRKKKKIPARYFEELVQNEDAIMLESDSDVDMQAPDFIVPSPPKRAWSPSVPIRDSSDEEASDVPMADKITPPTPSTHAVLSSLTEEDICSLTAEEISLLGLPASQVTLVSLPLGNTISLVGTYSFTVLSCGVAICGVTVPASRITHRVFAPKSSPLPVLKAIPGNDTFLDSVSLPPRLLSIFQRDRAVLALQESRTGIEGMGRVCGTFQGMFEAPQSNSSPDLQLAGVQMITHLNKELQFFTTPPAWESALSSVSEYTSRARVFLVKGPKKSGKSTFARTLLNCLLSRYHRVAYLECDVGQSEFTPGGMVALNVIESPIFGPPFTHPTIPNMAHYVGASTPRSSPSHYLASIHALVQSYRLDIQTPVDGNYYAADDKIMDAIPLVVNTMGWAKGLGADLTRKIVDIVEPTDIFEVTAPVFEQGWPAPAPELMPQENNIKVHMLQPISPSLLSTKYSPADHRSLSILSYFHAVFPGLAPRELEQVTATTWNTALPLCAHPPYEVDWSRAFDKVMLTGAGAEDIVPSEVDHVLNGALVGLVAYEPGTLDAYPGVETLSSPNPAAPRIPYTQGTLAPSPSSSMCHGLALIRSVSLDSSHIHVVTPLPPHVLGKTRVLVKGELELPVWGMLDFTTDNGDVAGVEKSKVPYLQWGKGEGLGGERRRIRRNLMRKGQM